MRLDSEVGGDGRLGLGFDRGFVEGRGAKGEEEAEELEKWERRFFRTVEKVEEKSRRREGGEV